MSSAKLKQKTHELCEAIVEELLNDGIKTRIDAFLANDAARSQYESLMSKGQALQEKQHNGQTLEPAEIAAFETERDTLLKNPVAVGFFDAQEAIHGIQHCVQKRIGKTLELGRVPTEEDLGDSGCGSGGCGCHGH